MMASHNHLAHFNWATLRADVGHPDVAEFVDAVERVNQIAERSKGFVWRDGNESGHAKRIGWPLFDDDRTIASFSVWERPEDLRAFVYKTVHGAFLRRGANWFLPGSGVNYALWWVTPGHIPTIIEARDKVETMIATGPSQEVFDFSAFAPVD